MLLAVKFDGIRLGILDKDDNMVEYYTPSEIKHFIKDMGIEIYGVKVDESINPMYTVDGLSINLFYQQSKVVGKFRVALLKSGDRWGSTFSTMINKPTVAFFDAKTKLSKKEYPSGQYIASYYVETILSHDSKHGLILNGEVPSWKVKPKEMQEIQDWLKQQLSM